MQKQQTISKKDALHISNKESNRLTRECLQTALIWLMSQKPFEKITISELVRRAGVSRTAFYRNYSSKEEILHELGNSFLNGIRDSLSRQNRQRDPAVWYGEFFQSVRENKLLFGLLLQARLVNPPGFFVHALKRLSMPDRVFDYYAFLAWEGGFSSVVIRWFEDGMQEEPSYMAALCARLLPLPRKPL
ncbi:MAG: TetR/AcrR family transcriptional regulator [Lachnospiraceae bacterium]|nr:TetR/AcrR family transcriptional regulator [Lachnospiraceae bacterium]